MRLFSLVVILFGLVCCGQPDPRGRYFPLPDDTPTVVHSNAQSFSIDTVVTGLQRPWSVAFLPNDRVLITQRSGDLLLVRDGGVQAQPVGGNVPQGLRDVDLHPEYENNRWIYLSYYIDPVGDAGGYTVLMRGRLDGHVWVDEEVLYKAGPFENDGHWFGSRIAFDEEGYLFFTVGIRGERSNAQDLSHQGGKTMRLLDDGRIPPDNPFVDSTDALPEIYTYGHRMHEGLALHPVTREMWLHEHGELGGDEINILRAGSNYGWPIATYSLEYDGSLITSDTLRPGVEPPIHHWTPSIGPSGMAFVFGEQYPGWKGDLFTGALPKRRLNRTIIDNGCIIGDEKLLESIGRVRDVEFAPDGLLYILTEDTGLLVRLLPAEETSGT